MSGRVGYVPAINIPPGDFMTKPGGLNDNAPLAWSTATDNIKDGGGVLYTRAQADAAIANQIATQHASDNATYVPSIIVSSAVGDGVTDATSAIQAALDAANTAGGGCVYVPGGTYLVSTTLTIGSNTELQLAKNATIKRNAAINAVLINKSDGVTGGYAQASDVTVHGGTWDGNAAGFPNDSTIIAFGHAARITIRDTTIKNGYGWHHVEVSACQRVIVRNVRFLDFTKGATSDELLQIDLMVNSGAFPWFGPYDNTPCDDVLVEGCTFKNGDRGIGSHSAVNGFPHTNVRIIGNHFDTFTEEAMHLQGYTHLVVHGNTITNAYKGIYVKSYDQALYNFVVTSNVIHDFTAASARAIHFDGLNLAASNLRHITIADNTIRTITSYGITLDYVSRASVRGNTVGACGTTGIYFFKGQYVVIEGNHAISNTQEDIRIGTDGTVTDTQDARVANNIAALCQIRSANRVFTSGNFFTSALNSNGTPAATNVTSVSNVIAGTYTA